MATGFAGLGINVKRWGKGHPRQMVGENLTWNKVRDGCADWSLFWLAESFPIPLTSPSRDSFSGHTPSLIYAKSLAQRQPRPRLHWGMPPLQQLKEFRLQELRTKVRKCVILVKMITENVVKIVLLDARGNAHQQMKTLNLTCKNLVCAGQFVRHSL